VAWEHGLDSARWSFALGVIEGAAGLGLFAVGGLAFLQNSSTEQGMMLLENWQPGLTTTHLRGLGLVNALAWAISPVSWPFTYLMAVGLARCVAFVVTREAVAEPLVWLVVRARQAVRNRRENRRLLDALGPVRPDRRIAGEDGELIVLTSREKPEWTATVTVEIDERYYRVVDRELYEIGEWTMIAYRLRENDPGAVIRRLVRYLPGKQI